MTLTSTTWRRASERNFALEGFGQQRVVERGEEDQQRAAAQIELEAGEDVAEIGADALRLRRL